MPSSLVAIVAAVTAVAVLAIGVYHIAFVAPRLRALAGALARQGDGPIVPSFANAAASANGNAASDRLAALEAAVARDLLRIGFVRYNSFHDVGSDQSFTLALLSAAGDGVIVSSIFAREETRTYGKSVRAFVAQQDASQEEVAAIALARGNGAFVRA